MTDEQMKLAVLAAALAGTNFCPKCSQTNISPGLVVCMDCAREAVSRMHGWALGEYFVDWAEKKRQAGWTGNTGWSRERLREVYGK